MFRLSLAQRYEHRLRRHPERSVVPSFSPNDHNVAFNTHRGMRTQETMTNANAQELTLDAELCSKVGVLSPAGTQE